MIELIRLIPWDWMGATCLIPAIWIIGNKLPIGFLIAAAGCTFCLIASLLTGLYGFVLIDAILIVIYLRNFIKNFIPG